MCKLCETKPVYEFTNQRKLCRNCFVHWFEKKFLYIVRKFEMFGKDDVIGYVNDYSFRGVVLEEMLVMYSKKAFVDIMKNIKSKRVTKIALSSTTDSEAEKIVHEIVYGDIKNLKYSKPVDGKIVKPLYLFLDKEVLLYAKIKRLGGKVKKVKSKIRAGVPPTPQNGARTSDEADVGGKWNNFINFLEKKHPEIKQAIVKGILKIEV